MNGYTMNGYTHSPFPRRWLLFGLYASGTGFNTVLRRHWIR